MKRTHSLKAFTAQLNFGKERLKRHNKRIFYKIKGFPEGKVVQLKRFWLSKSCEVPKNEYEQFEKLHRKSLKEVISQPRDEQEKAILKCLHNMLNSYDHPYGMVVAEFGKEIINSFEAGDMGAALEEIKSRLITFSASMAETAFLQYRDIIAGVSLYEFTTMCQDAIYEVLLSREPNVILDYYHIKFAKQDHALCSLSEDTASRITPADLEISQKFWLTSKNRFMPPPYCAAISVFQQFPQAKSPLAKVDVLRDTARSICLSVEQFWDVNRSDFPRGEDPAISADDLVAIFSYVIIKSKVSLLYSDSEYICDFLSDRNLMGETGYLITTFQCCCMALAESNSSDLLKSPN